MSEEPETLAEAVEEAVETEVTEAEAPDTETTEPEEQEDNPLFSALFEAAEEEEEAEPEQIRRPSSINEALDSIEDGEEATEDTQEATEPEAVEEPEGSEPKKKKPKKVKQVVDPEVPEAEEPAFKKEDEDPDKESIEALLPEEREFYDMARFANEKMEGYDGLDGQFLEYFKKSKEYVDKRLSDDPFVELGDDQEYRKFIKENRPNFTPQDAKKVEQEMFISKAEERALEKMRPEVERIRREQELAQKKPVIAQKKNNFRATSQNIIPEAFREKLAEGGEDAVAKLKETNPLEFQVMDQVSSNLLALADTFVDVTNGAVDYDDSNAVHKQLLEWVQKEQDNYIESGDTKKDGKTFMRRERFFTLTEEQQTEYFTWTDDDLLGIMAVRAKQQLTAMLEHQQQVLTQAGYSREAQPQAPARQPQPVNPQQPPRVPPTPRQGGGEQAPTAAEKQTPLSVLGM